jgi:YVTN family beta-propeller protein
VSNGCLTTELDNSVTVIDPQALKVVGTIPTGQPAYVSCDASGQVAALDLKTWKVEKLIDTGPGAGGLAWARTE